MSKLLSIVHRDASFKFEHATTLQHNVQTECSERSQLYDNGTDIVSAIGSAHAGAFYNHFGPFEKVVHIFCTLHGTRYIHYEL